MSANRGAEAKISFPGFGEYQAELLDRLVHLSRFGPDLIVVTGEHGSGKTWLQAQLARRLGLDSQAKSAQRVLLVDDADQLDDVAILRLKHTMTESGKRLLLFGQPSLSKRVTAAHHERILALGEAEVQAYLHARYPERSFSDAQCEAIWRRSKGKPAAIDRLCEDSGSQTVFDRPRRLGLPVMHMGALVTIALAIVLSIFYGTRIDASHTPATQTLEIPGSVFDSEVPADLQTAIATDPAGRLQAKDVGAGTVNEANTSRGPVEDVALVADPAAIRIGTGTTQIVSKPDTENRQVPVSSVQSLANNTAQEPPRFVEPIAGLPLSGRLSSPPGRISEWWLKADPGAWTLQVIGLSGEREAIEFISGQKAPAAFGYFVTEMGGKPWFVVTLGLYTSREDARAAVEKLPLNLKRLSPWARPLDGIQAGIVASVMQ